MAITSHFPSTHCYPPNITPLAIPQWKLALPFSTTGRENDELRLDFSGWKLEAIVGFFPHKFMIKIIFKKRN